MSVQSRSDKIPLWQRSGPAGGVSGTDGGTRRIALPRLRFSESISANQIATRLGGRAGVALGVLLLLLVVLAGVNVAVTRRFPSSATAREEEPEKGEAA